MAVETTREQGIRLRSNSNLFIIQFQAKSPNNSILELLKDQVCYKIGLRSILLLLRRSYTKYKAIDGHVPKNLVFYHWIHSL